LTDDGAVTSTPPHATEAAAVAAAFAVQPATGLTDDEAARRLARSGANLLARRTATPLWRMVWDAASEPFIVVLLVSGVLAIFLGEVRDGLLVMVGLIPIVAADVVTGFRAERALEALNAASAPVARVRRHGEARDIAAADLVAGDIVLLRVGDVVPADLRRWPSGAPWRTPAPRSSAVAAWVWSWRAGERPSSGRSPAAWPYWSVAAHRCSGSSIGWCASCSSRRWP
jgi:hypothetical protein